ncbi:MAG: hypothetical protein CMJ18_26500 [Phycisphaeraceae bacterium]|nr:hypothetical protein [Phycisphaeraceae bacterium]
MAHPEDPIEALEEDLPQALVDDLADVCDARVLVPTDLDRAVLDRARHDLARRRRWRRRPAMWATAASIGLAASLTVIMLAGTRGKALHSDINQDGTIDVLDAFAIARGIRTRDVSMSMDVNDDGVVDQQDVDALAARAVRLPEETS